MDDKIKISLASARVNAEMTQEAVAHIMRVSKQTIGNWERGRISPGKAQVAMLADIYGIPAENLRL